MNKSAILVLADGTIYEGISVGASGKCVGEMIFNTSMTGYQEILTDPSYAKQIVSFTAANIGNTGCNRADMESGRIWAEGVVMRNCSLQSSNYRAELNFTEWLQQHGIVAIAGVDTRALTLHLRENGALGGCISTEPDNLEEAQTLAKNFAGLNGMNLATVVSRQTIERWHEGRGAWAGLSKPQKHHVVVYDFGVKHNILRILYDLGCHITIVPASTPAKDVLQMQPDGIVLSNGPGDPAACIEAIAATKEFLDSNIPLLGICLGFQILALACGGTTKKMKFGHHGGNHPVQEVIGAKRVFITSQNHGFAVDEATLPDCLKITHRSLFDQTLQGIVHTHRPAFGFQGHPEANPGPHDIEYIFEQWIRTNL